MGTLGDFDASAVVYGKFTTYRPSTGAAYTLGGTPALSVYKDNSTTESTAGVTLTADFDSRTGLNHFAIDTSADGTFYSAGSFFDVVITTGTVDGVSVVGAVVASFTIRKNSSLKPATAGRTLVVDASGLADANMVKMGPTGSGTAQTARDIGASVLLSSGTGTGQLNFTSGVVQSDAAKINGVATSSVTTINANLGTTQPTNFTGTGASALVKSDLIDIAGTAWASTTLFTLASHDPGATLGTSTLTQTQVTGGAYALNSASFAFNAALDLTTAQKASVNAEADTALSDVGVTSTVTARIDVAVSTRLASASYTAPLDAAGTRSAVGLASANLDTQLAAIPSAAANADAVWDETLSGHLGTGSTGEALNAAGAAGDPWTTSLPGAYGAGSAGYIIGTNLDAAVSGVSGLDAAGVRAAIGLASANLDTQLDALPTATENADALLNRDMSAVSDTNDRTPLNALRFIRNKWSVSGSTLTVKKEDDTTTAWTGTVSTSAGADPVVGNDPA